MSRQTRNNFLRNTIIYAIFAGLLGWLIYFNEFTLGELGNFLPNMSEQMMTMSLDMLLVPILAAGTVFYISSLVGIFFEGTLAEVLVGTLYAVAFASFFSLFLILNPVEGVNRAGYLLSGAFGVLLVYNLVATWARIRKSPPLRAFAISASIYAEGQIAIRLISLLIESSGATMPGDMITGIAEFVNLGVSIAAIFTLFAIFKDSGNAYLSSLGSMASNYLFSVSLSLIGALYYGFFLGGLSTYAPEVTSLTPYVEWTGICIIAALLFTVMRRGMQGSIMVRNRLGDWRKHLQTVTTYKGDRFVGFTEIIDDFVEKGHKERLFVKLALFLHENHVADDEISNLLVELINYEDAERPAISRSGRSVVIENHNMERRLYVLQNTISRITPIGGIGPVVPAETAENAGQVAATTEAES